MLESLRDLSESALVALCPEAEPVVGRHRMSLDRAARWGVPAHVTVLYPFVPPGELTGRHLARVASLVSSLPSTEIEFGDVGWFGDQVVYLCPEPASWFRAATTAVHAEFPDYPPYQGEFEDVVPHLTVGDRGDLAAKKEAVDAIRPALPVRSRITDLALMAGHPTPGSWRLVRRFALGPAR